MSAQVKQAIILAAGKGTRIRKGGQILPKPLVRVGGLTLLKRAVLTGQEAGIERFVIVVGCDGEQVRAATENDPDLAGVELVFVENPLYELSNGVSVLQARPHIDGEFFLLMADHIVDASIYHTLQNTPSRDGLVLAVDSKLDTIFDMDDATKVCVGQDNTIAKIGKELETFDAVDTGVFRCAPALFEKLDEYYQLHGDTSLSNGVQALANTGRARVADVGKAWWQDVDTPETIGHAHHLLLTSVTRPTEDPVGKYLNIPFRRWLTLLTMSRGIAPKHMTALALMIGLSAAFVTAAATLATMWMLALGGGLYQLAAMIRGCDSQLALLKFEQAETGAWFDTVTDDVVSLTYQLAVGYALLNLTGSSVWLQISIATFVVGWLMAGALYKKLRDSENTARKTTVVRYDDSQLSALIRLYNRMDFATQRDFYALILMAFALIGPAAMKVGVVASLITLSLTVLQFGLTTLSSETPCSRERKALRGRG